MKHLAFRRRFVRAEIFEEFLSKVHMDPNSGCWLWTAGLVDGYGTFWDKSEGKRKAKRAHRISYEHFKGDIPSGKQIDHLCRLRCCVNPHHLEAVTQLENVQRGNAGKHLRERTHCPSGHEYTEDNTRIKQRSDGRHERVCRECCRIRAREDARQKAAVRPKKAKPVITHCPKGHEYTERNSLMVKVGRYTCRACRECRRLQSQKTNKRNRQQTLGNP